VILLITIIVIVAVIVFLVKWAYSSSRNNMYYDEFDFREPPNTTDLSGNSTLADPWSVTPSLATCLSNSIGGLGSELQSMGQLSASSF
jgi:hypothetical protein